MRGEGAASASRFEKFRLRLICHCRWVSRGESGGQKGEREQGGKPPPPPLL